MEARLSAPLRVLASAAHLRFAMSSLHWQSPEVKKIQEFCCISIQVLCLGITTLNAAESQCCAAKHRSCAEEEISE